MRLIHSKVSSYSFFVLSVHAFSILETLGVEIWLGTSRFILINVILCPLFITTIQDTTITMGNWAQAVTAAVLQQYDKCVIQVCIYYLTYLIVKVICHEALSLTCRITIVILKRTNLNVYMWNKT